MIQSHGAAETFPCLRNVKGYNFPMPPPAAPVEALGKILDAHRRGHCDKMQALNLIEALRSRSSDSETDELRKSLVALFRESVMTSKNVGGYIVNMSALALCCLAEFCSFQQLMELVFSRFPMNDPPMIEVWVREIFPDLQWSLMRCQERVDADALHRIRAQAAMVRASAYIHTPSVVTAMENLEKTADWIEFHRFEKTLLSRKPSRHETSKSTAAPAPISALPPDVARALEEAQNRLETQGPFDSKTAADLIRGAMEEAHREFVKELVLIYGGGPPIDDTDGARRSYMRVVGFITKAEEKFFSAIYSLISEEASHKLIAPRETILLLHQTVFSYLLLLTERLRKHHT